MSGYATPDTLAALELVTKHAADVCSWAKLGTLCHGDTYDLRQSIAVAREAIAKAKGGSIETSTGEIKRQAVAILRAGGNQQLADALERSDVRDLGVDAEGSKRAIEIHGLFFDFMTMNNKSVLDAFNKACGDSVEIHFYERVRRCLGSLG